MKLSKNNKDIGIIADGENLGPENNDAIDRFRERFLCKCGDPNCLTEEATVVTIEQFLLQELEAQKAEIIEKLEGMFKELRVEEDKYPVEENEHPKGYNQALSEAIEIVKDN